MPLLDDKEHIEDFDIYPGHVNNLLKVLNSLLENDADFSAISRIGKLVSAKVNNSTYSGELISRSEKLFAVYFGFKSIDIIDFSPVSRVEKILYSKIKNIQYTDKPLSLLEELLLQLGESEPVVDTRALVDYAVVGTAVI